MEELVQQILSDVDKINSSEEVQPLLINFINVTHKSAYLLRPARHKIIHKVSSIYDHAKPILNHDEYKKAFDEYKKILNIIDETVFNIMIADFLPHIKSPMDHFAYFDFENSDGSSPFDFNKKFMMLHEIIVDMLKSDINRISLLNP